MLAPGTASGQSASLAGDRLQLTLGTRTWVSDGAAEFSIGAPSGTPNILSELKWNGIQSPVVEFHGEALAYRRLLLTSAIGFGGIGGGSFRDQDFDGNNRTGLYSDATASVEGRNLFYANADLGWRALTWGSAADPRAGFLDLLLGYQYWRETYVADRAVQVVPATGPLTNQGAAITERFEWSSLRLGARTAIPVIQKVSLHGRVLFVPWSRFDLTDIHHLRTDLKQDPSFAATTTGGKGVQLDAGISYNFWGTAALDLGYRFWQLESGEGSITARGVDGDTIEPFHGALNRRHGPTVGLSYRF